MTQLIALEPHQHAMLSFQDPVGERPGSPIRCCGVVQSLELLRNRTTGCLQYGRNLFFVVVQCLHGPLPRPPSRCDGGPCWRDKVQTVETLRIVIARQAR